MNETPRKYTFAEKIKSLGPGFLIVGGFIGPGTITSATKAGAGFGYTLLWTVIFSVIAVISFQEMSARMGVATRKDFGQNIVEAFSGKPLLRWTITVIIIGAGVVGTIAYCSGDLTGTALGLSALTGLPISTIAVAWGIVVLLITYCTKNVMKFLEKLIGICVAVMSALFVLTVIVAKPDLGELFSGVIPKIPTGAAMTCLSLVGTTVIPQFAFIHSASARDEWTVEEMPLAKFSTIASMIVGGIITGAVMITSATVMQGMTVENAIDMSVQLEPLLGSLAKPVLCIGMTAAGVSSSVLCPTLSCIVAASVLGWKQDKSDKRFLALGIATIVIGIAVILTGINPIAIIMTAQAFNAIFLPISVILLLYLCNRKIMGQFKNSVLANVVGIFVAVVALVLGGNSLLSMF